MNSRRLREHGQRVPTMRSNYVSIPPRFSSSPTAALINPLLQAVRQYQCAAVSADGLGNAGGSAKHPLVTEA
jgi:hypothetical protein